MPQALQATADAVRVCGLAKAVEAGTGTADVQAWHLVHLAGFAVLLKWNKDPRRDSRQRGGSETRTACQTWQKVEQAWHLVHWGVASE